MIHFLFKHPVATLLSVLIHFLVGLGFWVATQDSSDIIKVRMQSAEHQATTLPNTLPFKEVETLKTFAVDSSLVEAQLARIKQEEALKEEERLALLQKTEQEKRRLEELKRKQEEAKRKADLEKQKALLAAKRAEEAKQRTLEEKQKVETQKKRAEEAKRAAELEQRRAQEAKRLAEIEKQKVEAQKKRAEEEALKAEKSRQEALLAEKQRLEAEKQIKEAEQQRLAEEAKKKALEEEIKRRDAEKKRLQQEALAARLKKEQEEEEAALQRQLAAEEAERQRRLAAEEAKQREAEKAKQMLSLREAYISGIAAKVKDNWRTAGKVDDRAECVLAITQTPKGNISSVKVEKCNQYATAQFKKDAEKAVYRSEPLPPPPVEELFERNVKFIFNP